MEINLSFSQSSSSWHCSHLPFALCLFLFVVPEVFAQKPELVVTTQHSSFITSVCFSPDGKYLATGSWDKTAKLWDVVTGREIRTFSGHASDVTSVSFSPDGKFILTVSADKTVRLWDIATGQVIRTFTGHSHMVESANFDPEGKYIASGCADSTAKLWEVATGKEIRTFSGHSSYVESVSFTPNGLYVVTGSLDDTAKLWEVETGKEIRTFHGHSDGVTSVSISPNGKYLATGSWDKTAKLWDLTTGAPLLTLSGHTDFVSSVAFSPDGKSIVTGSEDGTAIIWDVTTGGQIRTLNGHSTYITAVSFSPDGKYIATGSWDVSAKLWEVDTGREFRTFGGHYGGVYAVDFSPNGKYIATGHWDDTAKLWDIVTGRATRSLSGHSNWVTSVSFSPDSEYLATGSNDETIKLWEMADGREGHTFHVNSGGPVRFSSDGKYLVIGNSKANTVELMQVDTGKEIRSFEGHSSAISSVCLSSDGKYLITGSNDDTAKLWDVASGQEIRTFRGHSSYVKDVSLSADAKYVITGSADDTAKLWEFASDQEIYTIRGHSDQVASVRFSPNGKCIATGSYDKTAKLWDMTTGKEIRTFSGHSESVNSLSFSPDGKCLVTGSEDATAKLWEVNSGKEIVTFMVPDSMNFVIATPDYYYLASKGALKSVAFRLEKNAFPFEQFDLRFNRPDIVLQRIGYAPSELIEAFRHAYQKRLKKMHFTEDMLGDDFHLPEIAITTETPPLTTQNKQLQFKVKASESKYLLDRLNVYVNDVPIYGINGIDLRNKKAQAHKQEISLELSSGRNKIQVSVLNDKGAESLRETFEVVYDGQPAKPDLYLITIGVSEYVDSRYNLKWAAKDADDLATLLESQKDRFNRVHTFKLLSRNATKENILQLRNTLMQSKVDDEVILFVAGHGLLDKNLDYYFATTDIDFENPSEKGLPYEAIEGLLDGIPARKKLLLMDTCHSGEVDKEETVLAAATDTASSNLKSRSFRNVKPISQTGKLGLSNSFQLMQELFANLSRGSGAVVISAASGVEYAYEDQQWQNGVFTYCVLEGLKSRHADLNKDGEIRVSELKDYVTEKVQKLTQGRQTPTSRRENLEFDFRVF